MNFMNKGTGTKATENETHLKKKKPKNNENILSKRSNKEWNKEGKWKEE